MRRNSVSSLGSFIQHEVDFSCSVCARRHDRYIANENERRLSINIDTSSLFRERINRSGENGVSSEGRDISGFTGVSTREVSAVLNFEEEEAEEDSIEKAAKSELEKARTRQEREKYIMEAILIAKDADAKRPSQHLKMVETEKTGIDDVIMKKKKPYIRRKRGVADSKEEGNEEPLTFSMIERRLEVLRNEELRIRERVRGGR